MDSADKNAILCHLSWDEPVEIQRAAVDDVLRRQDLDLSLFLQPGISDYPCGGKKVWDNCATIFLEAGYPRCKKYLDGLFEWIQDMNWPGAETIEKLLLSLPHEAFMPPYEVAIQKAAETDDSPWLFILSMYVEMRRLKREDFTDGSCYQAMEKDLPEATDLIRRVIEWRKRKEVNGCCPECGAPIVDGMDCSGLLGSIIAWEYNDPDLLAEHFKTVASFNLQHPAQFTDEALEKLRLVFIEHLDHGLPIAEIRKRMGEAFKGTRKVLQGTAESQPVLREWKMTIADVYIPDHPEGAAQRVRDWAAAIRKDL